MSERKQRVLHVITALGFGGVEVWLMALLEHMRQRKLRGETVEEFDILMTGGRKAELDRQAQSLGATLHYIRFSRKNVARFARDFRRLLRDRHYTAIHDHQDYTSAWHFMAGAGLLPPLRIVHVHNPVTSLRVNTHTKSQKALFAISRRIVKRIATHVLGTSAQVLGEYGFTSRAFPRQVIRPLHCGFDVRSFEMSHDEANVSVCSELEWPLQSRICIFAGRLEGFDPRNPAWNHKNPRFALETVRDAIAAGADIRAIFAGDGERMREQLERDASAWGIGGRVRFVGKRRDVPRLMAASRICLFPSLEEGLGMVAVEAQAAGLRVLASDTVPHEARVVTELVTFMPLAAGSSAWGAELKRLMELPRFDPASAADAVRHSPFSIDESYAQLHAIYSSASTIHASRRRT